MLSGITSQTRKIPQEVSNSRAAKLVLTIPHRYADAERVFSIIGKNKVKNKSDLALEGTLSSLTTCKVNQFFDEPCYYFEPSREILDKAKKATFNYCTTKLISDI